MRYNFYNSKWTWPILPRFPEKSDRTECYNGNIFSLLRCIEVLQSLISTQKYTNKLAKRRYSNAWKTHVLTEVSTSTEFCTQYRKNHDYSALVRTKRNLEQSELELSNFCCVGRPFGFRSSCAHELWLKMWIIFITSVKYWHSYQRCSRKQLLLHKKRFVPITKTDPIMFYGKLSFSCAQNKNKQLLTLSLLFTWYMQ